MIATGGSLKMQHFLTKLMKRQTLGPIVMNLCELIKIEDTSRFDEIRNKQRKLSEVTDMIYAAHVFHRTVRNLTPQKELQDQDSVLSLLVGDYLLAQSSVDMASLRYPKTVGLVAKGLEDYTKGEFLKIHLIERCRQNLNDHTGGSRVEGVNDCHKGINQYAELTCGSLLSNACLSAFYLAGNTERCNGLGDLVYSFGHNTGSAQRLIEIVNYPNEDDKVVLSFLSNSNLEQSITRYLDKSIEILQRLPDGRTKPALRGVLEKMRGYLIAGNTM